MMEQKARDTKELEKLKHLVVKIQEVISNIITARKNEKLCQNTRIPGTQMAFFNKVTSEILMLLMINQLAVGQPNSS